ncbi:haloacid dehalogenase superfamily, subfamily IA, variant 3 with third motif having DD or ED [Monaibacterium marinum]|uniref:Haloacid dehalogenase superfamily, subfamily IA, variant 3 with third motif having DD or ED n=1 Tax=Pontivivens marinum TaxID=1690039 RepID=A0A2C9CLW7_9RHOB|nr:HAD family hydrolase [Monaibacterium marinum]SOH92263.1 haloacid dehalogenase superfamily, subfamily IA, variant 3 with third motif having DD or ED [Monaibacterium marinum]
MNEIDLVIFDCDGVLIDSEGLSAQVLIKALAKLDIDVDIDYFCANFVGRSFPTVAQDIRNRWNVALPEGFEASYRADLLAEFETHLHPTDGLEEMLTRLQTPWCVATSSSPERVSNSLRITGLAHWFEGRVFTASEVKNGKPAPDLFLHAARKIGVDPARCLVIEDSVPGVQAALAANMRVLRYTGGLHLRGRVLKHPDTVVTFDNWSELGLLAPEMHFRDGGHGGQGR